MSEYNPKIKKEMCPFIKDPPSKDCYNVKLDSQSIINFVKLSMVSSKK